MFRDRSAADGRVRTFLIPLVAVLGIVAAMLLVGALASSSGAVASGSLKKPKPTTTASTTPTTSATPTPSPTATATATATSTPATTDTATPTPTASASASSPACTPVTYQDQTWCPATIAGVNAGDYGTGARVVLQGVNVDDITGTVVSVSSWTSQPCPPGYYCGATVTVDAMQVDFAGLTDLPALWDVIDLYGTTGAPGFLQPVGYVNLG